MTWTPPSGYPPPPVVHESEIQPNKRGYWYAALVLVVGIVGGIVLFFVADAQLEDESPGQFALVLLGWLLLLGGFFGGKAWLVLIALKRGQHRRELMVRRRAEQMGWNTYSYDSDTSPHPDSHT